MNCLRALVVNLLTMAAVACGRYGEQEREITLRLWAFGREGEEVPTRWST